jgi:hypothetical protein
MYLSNLHFEHFITDLINLVFFLIPLIYFCIKYHIKKNTIIILFIFLLTPFLFYFLLPWYIHPDQSKYLSTIFSFRDFSYDKSISFLLSSRLDFSSFLYALFPIPFVSTIISVGLINKGMLYVLVLFFLNKKKYFLTKLLLFLPSLIFFSSTALREILVICIGVAFFYVFLEKKNYFQSFFFAGLFLLIKPHFGILCLAISVSYYVFFIKLNLNLMNIKKLSFCMILILLIFIILFFLRDKLIEIRFGFFSEEFGYQLISKNEIISVFTILNSFIHFFFSPLSTKELNLMTIIITIENLFLLYVIIILLNKIYKKNQCKAIFWALVLLFLFLIFGFTVFNAGTIWRYKFVIQIVMISAIYFSLNSKNGRVNLL